MSINGRDDVEIVLFTFKSYRPTRWSAETVMASVLSLETAIAITSQESVHVRHGMGVYGLLVSACSLTVQTVSHPTPSIETCLSGNVHLHSVTAPFSYAHKRRNSSLWHCEDVEDGMDPVAKGNRCIDMMSP